MAKKYCRHCGREITGKKTYKKLFCSKACYDKSINANSSFWGKDYVEKGD